MLLTPRLYRSTDPGAPQLTGQAGALTALLDAVLVNGYGAGADAKSPLGWTLEFSAINKRAYRNNPVEGSGSYLRVDDTSSIGNARHAWLRAYKTLESIDGPGADATPSPADIPEGMLWVKSRTLDAVARPWIVVGNCRGFYVGVDEQFETERSTLNCALDLLSNVTDDQFNFFLSGNGADSYTGVQTTSTSNLLRGVNLSASSSMVGGYVMRDHNLSPTGSVPLSLRGESYSGNVAGQSGAPYPDPVSKGLLVSRAEMRHAGAYLLRGILPGLFIPHHQRPFADLTRLDGLEIPGLGSAIAKLAYSGSPNLQNQWGQVLLSLDRDGWI